MRVRVYRNLHKNLYSVQRYTKGKGWRVAFHVPEITLMDVEFSVSEAGRRRAIVEQRKNVHAFVIGEWIAMVDTVAGMDRAKYSPYVYNGFYVNGPTNDKIVRTADLAILNRSGLYITQWTL
jgi:hypothetical protein